MKHNIICLLLFTFLLLFSAGCRKDGAPIHVDAGEGTAPPSVPVQQSPETEAAGEEEPEAPAPMNNEEPVLIQLFGSGGRPKFTVVRAADADEETVWCASALIKAINQKTGKKFKLSDDASLAADSAEYEILIGPTNRPESEESAKLFAEAPVPGGGGTMKDEGGYLTVMIGNKICFEASDGRTMMKAVDDFAENWLGKGTVTVPVGGSSSGKREALALTRLTAETRPALIEPKHPTEDVVIADIVATDAVYGADPTGQKDSGPALKKALTACAAAGGGTVWLPAGQYLVTSTVEIPAFVTLRGEAPTEDPKTVEDYGTVIIARPKSGSSTAASLFVLRGSCGVVGMTVWYPEQSLAKPTPYPYIFYVTGNGQGGYMLQTIRDVLVVNGWKGVGACVTENNAHEQTTIENFRGTFLCHAVKSCNEADVGTFTTVRVSPSYWADSPFEGSPDREELAAYTRENAEGLVLGDLEWDQFADILVEDCSVGIHTVKGIRATFTGEMIDVTVRRCGTGLLADDMDGRWGMNLARSVFEDCEVPIVNNTRGMIKLTDVTVPEGSEITGMVRAAEGDLSGCAMDYGRKPSKPAEAAWTVPLRGDNTFDISADLQEALDLVSGEGGGVLYIPAGFYRLEKPVTVPAGVELRGSSSVGTRGQNGWSQGTLISTAYGLGQSDDAAALITLGEGAGVSGLRFVYPENGPGKAAETPFVIRGTGAGVYCVNVSIAAAGSGVDFRGCDGHYIKKVTACCYDRGIAAGGKNGRIEGCLQNATVMMRHGLNFLTGWIPESEVFAKLFPILRKRSVFLTLEGAEGEQVLEYFAYGVMTVLEVRDSKNVLVADLGGDNIGDKAPLIRVTDSGLTVINAQRYNGILYETEGNSEFNLYNPLSVDNKREKNVIRGEEYEFRAPDD